MWLFLPKSIKDVVLEASDDFGILNYDLKEKMSVDDVPLLLVDDDQQWERFHLFFLFRKQ